MKNIASQHLFLQGILAYGLLCLGASEVKGQVRNDTLAKRLGFLQMSPTDIHGNIAARHFFHCITTFQCFHLKASELEERIRSDTLAKHLT